ncbi:MAG: hypothetical protein ABUM51_08660, partial [Bacteroidota bacterium]
YGALLTCSLAYTSLQHATHLSRHTADWVKLSPEFKYLEQQHLKDYQFYIFDISNFIGAYSQFGVIAPTRWTYHHFWRWYPTWDTDHRILETIEQDLLKHRTTYVVDRSIDIRKKNPIAYDLWQSFLREHYQPVPRSEMPAGDNLQPSIPGVILWKIK